MQKELSVNFEIDFADSNIISYSIEGENITLLLECWNAEVLKIQFLNFASLCAMSYLRIADLKETFTSPLLERVLHELYENYPKEHNLRIFKFITSDDMTALEIVCEDIKIERKPV